MESGDASTRVVWLPWIFRRFLALPGHPLAIGAGVALLSVSLDFVCYNASGAWQGFFVEGVPLWLHSSGSISLSYALTFGIVVLALFYLVRGAEHDLSEIGPALGLAPRALADVRREILSVPAASLRIGSFAALVMAASDYWIAFEYSGLAQYNTATVAWFMIRELLLDLFMFRVFTWAIIVALRLSRFARGAVRVQLFDLEALRPFTHNGVRLALFWLLMWASWVPILFVAPMGEGGFVSLLTVILIGSSLSFVALTLPTRGARGRVRDAKAAELAVVRGAIERDRGAALDGEHPDRTAAASRLPGLLAYEERVAAVPERLIDSHSLRRVALYLLIPLGSWVGGAMIERLVDAALD